MYIISIGSSAGGAGKTTISANLAYELFQADHQILLIEASASHVLGISFGSGIASKRGLSDLFDQDSGSLQSVIEQNAHALAPDFSILTYGRRSNVHAVNPVEDVQRLFEGLAALKVESRYRDTIVIVDLPSALPAMSAAFAASDMILNIVEPSFVSLAANTQVRILPEFANRSEFSVILNKLDSRSIAGRDAEMVARAMFDKQCIGQIHYDEAVVEASGQKSVVGQYAPASLAAHDFAQLASRIADALDSPTNQLQTLS
ncbi:MAG: cellulose synthase operon protein YhjQ/BcsQ [Pseudomonadota bacterium]